MSGPKPDWGRKGTQPKGSAGPKPRPNGRVVATQPRAEVLTDATLADEAIGILYDAADDMELVDIAEAGTSAVTRLADRAKALQEENTRLREQLDRIARAAMHGAEVIEQVPYFNGLRLVAAAERFDTYWMTQLTAADLTLMRKAVGLPEPAGAEGD